MRARIEFVLLSWLSAWLIIMALFGIFGDQLQDLPLPLRALIISGVLVTVMTQLVIPAINRYLANRNSRT